MGQSALSKLCIDHCHLGIEVPEDVADSAGGLGLAAWSPALWRAQAERQSDIGSDIGTPRTAPGSLDEKAEAPCPLQQFARARDGEAEHRCEAARAKAGMVEANASEFIEFPGTVFTRDRCCTSQAKGFQAVKAGKTVFGQTAQLLQ
jgi:hypothetical protein